MTECKEGANSLNVESESTDVAPDSLRPQKLLEVASHCLDSGLYTDITFIVGDKRFPAHRLVMDSISDYFRSLFKADANRREVILDNVCAEDFESLLKFAYTGQLELTSENITRLLIAADYFIIDFVRVKCINHIASHLTIDNVCDVIIFSASRNLDDLLDAATALLKTNLEAISRKTAFSLLEPSFLAKIFSDDNLLLHHNSIILKPVAAEKLLLQSILRYISMREKGCGDQDVTLLLCAVRWPLLTEKVIDSCLEGFPQFKHHDAIANVIEQAKEFKLSKSCLDPQIEKMKETWLKQRSVSLCLHSSGKRYAIKRRSTPPDCIKTDFNFEISRVEIWLRRWDGRPVIGKLRIVYRNVNASEEIYSRGNHKDLEPHSSLQLENGEFITKVVVKSGELIDSLYFESNFGNTFGPFGGPGGYKFEEKSGVDNSSYLYDISCDSEVTLGSTAIINLMFRWVALTCN